MKYLLIFLSISSLIITILFIYSSLVLAKQSDEWSDEKLK